MSDLFEKSMRTLELPAVLEMLAQRAVSDEAKERCRRLRPSTEAETVSHLLDETDAAKTRLGLHGSPSFTGVKDVAQPLNRADHGGMLNTRELLDIAGVLTATRRVSDYDADRQGEPTAIDRLFSALRPNKYLEDKIRGAILDEETIADTASPELADIRRQMRVAATKGRQILQRIISSPSYAKVLQEALITQRDGRFVVPVKAECKGSLPGLVHDVSSSGATLFVEPMGVVQANNEMKELEAKEDKEIDRILRILSGECAAQRETILYNYDVLVQLDAIFARAQLSYAMDAGRPMVRKRGGIDLKRARHPLLDQAKAVPVTVELGGRFDTLVITGPNTGGKTVTLKTIGLLSLMAQCGLHIPAGDQSAVQVFSRILADVGDEQSIEQSLSTFSAHMANTVEILKQADDRSLILFDELGAGTDPVEGAALAMAVLESLHFKGAKIAATTHYAELKAYALETPRVENGCCEFNVATLSPTYRLLIGVPGRSNALAICERLGMDMGVVDRAKELVNNENVRFEDVVDKLEENRRRMEEEHERARELTAKAKAELERAEKRLAEVDSLREAEIEKAKAQAAKLTQQAKRESYALLDELDRLKKEKEKTKDASDLARRARAAVRKGLGAIDEAVDPVVAMGVEDDGYVLPRELKKGDAVLIADLGKEATVLSPVDRNGNVEVLAGAAKTRVKLKNLRLIENAPKKRSPNSGARRTGVESKMNMDASARLDVRGLTVDDCIMELDRYIDYTLRMGLGEFTVVHGKGTGALRSAVNQYLRKSPYVKRFRLGVYGEGEDGVTIVELK